MKNNSRIPGFYNLTLEQRQRILIERGDFTDTEIQSLNESGGLKSDIADHMIENVIGTYSLPFGIGLNFLINGIERLIPMVIEEPSVVAGASFMAKLARAGGGFIAHSDQPLMIGQIQILDIPDLHASRLSILENKKALLAHANSLDPVLQQLGGGARDVEVRIVSEWAVSPFLVVHLIYDVRDAMGANAVNTACEKIAPMLEEMSGGRVLLRILSNLADRRLARARCTIPLEELGFDQYRPEDVRDGIIAAWAFANSDPYRAATHNKGIMNGVDPVVIATGNDWRAIEAGAHAYAARNGKYASLSTWGKDSKGNLTGTLEMPMAVGIVGGATKVNPGAKMALKLMNITSAQELAEVIVSVGLAQNLAAMRALVTEGIQHGHMNLHARQVAVSAGAIGDEIPRLAQQLVEEKVVRIDRAIEILHGWRI